MRDFIFKKTLFEKLKKKSILTKIYYTTKGDLTFDISTAFTIFLQGAPIIVARATGYDMCMYFVQMRLFLLTLINIDSFFIKVSEQKKIVIKVHKRWLTDFVPLRPSVILKGRLAKISD